MCLGSLSIWVVISRANDRTIRRPRLATGRLLVVSSRNAVAHRRRFEQNPALLIRMRKHFTRTVQTLISWLASWGYKYNRNYCEWTNQFINLMVDPNLIADKPDVLCMEFHKILLNRKPVILLPRILRLLYSYNILRVIISDFFVSIAAFYWDKRYW